VFLLSRLRNQELAGMYSKVVCGKL